MTRFIVAVLLLLICSKLHASDRCSLVVKVTDPKGNPVLVPVLVEEENNPSVQQESRGGIVKFCGLGITPVNVVVGRPGCNQVVVRSVPLQWGRTTVLPVIYDREPCIFDAPPSAACVFLFRFYDNQGQVISGVLFDMQSPRVQTVKSDEYGRVFLTLTAGQQLEATARAPNRISTRLSIPCTSENQRVERRVTLQNLPKQ